MKTTLAITAMLGLLLCSCSKSTTVQTESDERIGTYDSRAIAVAAGNSSYYNDTIRPVIDAAKKAKAEGDQERFKELEKKMVARQHEMHAMGFGTASVDALLKTIEDQLPAIREAANVSLLISKWDKAGLAEHKGAEQIDVTMPLVDAFNPNERGRKWAEQVMDTKPLTDKQVKNMDCCK